MTNIVPEALPHNSYRGNKKRWNYFLHLCDSRRYKSVHDKAWYFYSGANEMRNQNVWLYCAVQCKLFYFAVNPNSTSTPRVHCAEIWSYVCARWGSGWRTLPGKTTQRLIKYNVCKLNKFLSRRRLCSWHNERHFFYFQDSLSRKSFFKPNKECVISLW